MASNISSHESEVETDSVDFNRMSEDKENISNLNRTKHNYWQRKEGKMESKSVWKKDGRGKIERHTHPYLL